MKIRFLSFVMIICFICGCCVPDFSFAMSENTRLRSDVYTITYNNLLCDNMNTVSDIPMNTAVNTFLYNMRKDNPDYLIDIFNASGKPPSLFGKITDYTTNRMYITVRKSTTDEGERFVLLPSVSSSVSEDFENYATGIFVSDSSWTYLRTRDNIGMAYIVCDSDSNRFLSKTKNLSCRAFP